MIQNSENAIGQAISKANPLTFLDGIFIVSLTEFY
jgi:hypothetical protein